MGILRGHTDCMASRCWGGSEIRRREYIGSVHDIAQLVAGEGQSESPGEFYRYWRSSARDWKKSPEAEKLLRRALEDIE